MFSLCCTASIVLLSLYNCNAELPTIVSEDNIIKKNKVTGFTFELPALSWNGTANVYYLQEDLNEKGRLIVSTWRGVGYATEDSSFSIIAGSSNSRLQPGYREGIGSAARFGEITSFVQHNRTYLILVDRYNNCLRWVNLETNQTSEMVGECVAGSERVSVGRFSNSVLKRPTGICRGSTEFEYFVTEGDEAEGLIRKVDIDQGNTFLLVERVSNFVSPVSIVFIKEISKLFVAGHNDIYKIDTTSGAVSSITSGSIGVRDGELEKSEFKDITSITSLSNELLMVLSIYSIRLVDLKNKQVSSLELWTQQNLKMHALLNLPEENSVLVGMENGISKISYAVSDTKENIGCRVVPVLLVLLLGLFITL